eukprot:CAMPEP_0118690060 /NCGR_PEP_ID=MMETSP0800-20121206/9859_1 /TAXON_ID=210618 ORGANISM="Striatella unipunctata, Strain CCMP2910" /NCGR_SAMPLE_ID=MMETSP0800 /ASSEMBLY_ACC=CAM_ASM_000638 /LENGTH=378 /DNA_ID=CAMNT_0006587575 /DNA_START=207 /DNA_END=1344 /DNA_ORIENTATION=-
MDAIKLDHYGHYLGPKDKNSLRLGFQNVNGFPATNYSEKNQATYDFLQTNEFDVFGAAKLNCHWKNMPQDHRLPIRTYKWFSAAHTSTTYNHTETPASNWQIGGVRIWSIDQMVHRISGQGSDQAGLSRWTWVRYRGKNQTAIRFVSGYRASKSSKGVTTAYAQQRSTLLTRNDSRCPRKAFLEDLYNEISKWQQEGDSLIIALDANEYMVQSPVSKTFEKCQLKEAIIKKYQGNTPATHNKGSKTIDYLEQLEIEAGGYLEGIPSDHQAVWVDIAYSSVLGHPLPPIMHPKARRLQCNDLRTTKALIDKWETFCKEHRLLEKAIMLENQATFPLNWEMQNTYKKLDKLRLDRIRAVEKLSKTKNGEHSLVSPITDNF